MCGRFELKTKFDNLPKVLKRDYPSDLNTKYQTQNLIRPTDPILVIKNEGKIQSTIMSWGFISPWAIDPFEKGKLRPFNAKSETVKEKKFFSESWKYKRCLIPASGFFEKNNLFRKENHETFWLGGIWSKWYASNGAEIKSCCILTTKSNSLVKPLHDRMPVVVPFEYEEKWIEQIQDTNELRDLDPILKGWSPQGWIAEEVNKKQINQMNLFK